MIDWWLKQFRLASLSATNVLNSCDDRPVHVSEYEYDKTILTCTRKIDEYNIMSDESPRFQPRCLVGYRRVQRKL